MSRIAIVLSLGACLLMAGCPKTPVTGPVKSSSYCQTTDECRNSMVGSDAVSICHNGRCVRCVTDVDCGEGFTCSDGSCEDVIGIAEAPEPGIEVGESEDSVVFEIHGKEMDIPSICRPSDPKSQPILSLQEVLFDYDDWTLTPVGRAVLDANADCLRHTPELEVVLEGHCDERGTVEYNLALGEKRASVVREYLEHLGISPDTLRVVSLGEDQPVCFEPTEACWSANRRVVLQVSEPRVETASTEVEISR